MALISLLILLALEFVQVRLLLHRVLRSSMDLLSLAAGSLNGGSQHRVNDAGRFGEEWVLLDTETAAKLSDLHMHDRDACTRCGYCGCCGVKDRSEDGMIE
jgi:hypothetical protein